MTVKEHIEIIDNPVVMEIRQGDKVLYHGYKGCFGHTESAKEIEELEVERFHLRIDGRRRTNDADRMIVNELNCGTFNYCDLHIELVYVYETKK